MNENTFERAKQRSLQYWSIDGLAEIVVGTLFTSLGVYFYALASLPADSSIARILEAGFAVLFIGGALLGKRLIQVLKTHLTYPRTGYVSYPAAGSKSSWISAGLAILMATFLAALIASAPASIAWLPAISGLIVGGGFLTYAARVGLIRFYLLAILSACLGFALSLAGLGDMLGLSVYYLLIGIVLVLSGGLALHRYIRNTSPPELLQ